MWSEISEERSANSSVINILSAMFSVCNRKQVWMAARILWSVSPNMSCPSRTFSYAVVNAEIESWGVSQLFPSNLNRE